MDPRQVRSIPLEQVMAVADTVQAGLVSHVSGGAAAMIWLANPAKTDAVVKAYRDQAAALGIQDIYSGARLALTLNSPAKDARTPDIVLEPELGVLGGPREIRRWRGSAAWQTRIRMWRCWFQDRS